MGTEYTENDEGPGKNEYGVDIKDSVMVRSRISSTHVDHITIEGEKKLLCPTCDNIVSDSNRRLVCEICGTKDFCESCERILTKVEQYRGYKLVFDWPLCRTCYKNEMRRQVMEIEAGKTDGYSIYAPPEERPAYETSMLPAPSLEPLLHTKHEDSMGKTCGILGLVIGIISVFAMGFILGVPAILLGYASRVREYVLLGSMAMLAGLLGIASSIAWLFITGSFIWYL